MDVVCTSPSKTALMWFTSLSTGWLWRTSGQPGKFDRFICANGPVSGPRVDHWLFSLFRFRKRCKMTAERTCKTRRSGKALGDVGLGPTGSSCRHQLMDVYNRGV